MADDLGEYDVLPVEGNPFGAMASSPNDYDVEGVDHDPFAGAGENPAPDQFELASRQPEATPSSAGGPPLDPRDRQDLIRTVYGEASDQPALGQAAVAHAILNRVHAGGYGDGISGVVHAPAAGVNPKFGYHEFSPWNTGRAKEGNPTAQNLSPDSRDPRLAKSYRDIGDVVDKAYSGLIPDPTHGATHYYGYMPKPPPWAAPLARENTVRIGGQTFVGGADGPGRAPVETAGYADGGGIDDSPAPTAAPTGLWGSLFGSPERRAAQPQSRGALLGMGGYQDMPDTNMSIDDERYAPSDQAFWMKNFYDPSNEGKYEPSLSGVAQGSPQVSTWNATETVMPLVSDDDGSDQGYQPSFQPNWRPRPSGQAPYRPSPVLHNEYGDNIGPMGPNLPRGPVGTSVDDEMPYMGAHLPISPGDPGWTPPPSRSGPHNPKGDPDRPGYGRPPPPISFLDDPRAQKDADDQKFRSFRAQRPEKWTPTPPRKNFPTYGPMFHNDGSYFASTGGAVQLNDDLRRRLALITNPRHGFADGGAPDDPFMQNAQLRSQQESEADQYRQAHPADYPAAQAPADAPTTWYGKWGQTLGDELSSVGPAVSAATEGIGNFGASVVANPVGYGPLSFRTMSPESEAALGRDFTGMLDSPVGVGEMVGAPRVPEAAAPRLGQVGSDVAHAAEPTRAKIMDINGVKRHIDPEFPESRVGTAVPSNEDPHAPIDAEQAAHANNDAHVGMELAAQAPTHGKAVADRVRDGRIPYVKVAPGASDAVAQEALIEHMKDNLLGLYNRVSGAVRSGSKLWYEGANSRSKNIAETHDIPHENAAGVVAAMSPQKDWDQNVTLADWVAHTAGTTADDATMSPEMTDWVNKYALRKDQERVVTDPQTGAETRFNVRTGEQMSPNSVSQQDVQRQLAQVSGKAWGQMTPDQKAFYTRAYYEAHGPPDHLIPVNDQTGEAAHWVDEKGDRKYGYYINNPDGTHDGVLARYGDEFPKKVGQPIPVSWGSTGEVANAIQAFGAQSMSDISEALGGGHKVRSFFNNIIAPWSKKGDVTSDTHAVAAALLRPLGAGSPEAASGMGAASPTHNETGLKGFYPHVAEAYRRAARDAGVLPRELQSITWEALRGLWSPREKMAKSNTRTGFTSQTDITNGIWQRYHNGQMTLQEAHNAILGPNGERIRSPRWFETFRP